VFVTQWSIPGAVEGAADAVNPKTHPAKINLYAGSALREAARKVKTEKVIVAEPAPHIVEVRDVLSGTANETLTAGGVVQIRGGRLKLLTSEANNGIFLVDEQGGEFKITVIVENKPARLIAVMPADIPQGDWFIEVRTSCSTSGKPMKSLKQGRYSRILTVI
jgi:hypothetical protein